MDTGMDAVSLVITCIVSNFVLEGWEYLLYSHGVTYHCRRIGVCNYSACWYAANLISLVDAAFYAIPFYSRRTIHTKSCYVPSVGSFIIRLITRFWRRYSLLRSKRHFSTCGGGQQCTTPPLHGMKIKMVKKMTINNIISYFVCSRHVFFK